MSRATVQCECGKTIEITPYLNADLSLVADDLAEKIRQALALTDAGSQEFHEQFDQFTVDGMVPSWRVLEAIREVLL